MNLNIVLSLEFSFWYIFRIVSIDNDNRWLNWQYWHFTLGETRNTSLPQSKINMDKYCLKWTKFQSNLTKTLSDLRKEEDFLDVTLVSEELQHISAHKLVLSSSSDLFKSILKATQTSNPHPLIYLSGVSAKHLNFAMNYIYQGEVEILQEDLGEFLNVAKKLKIEGLIEGNPPKEDIDRQEANESRVSAPIKTEITMEEDSISTVAQSQDDNIFTDSQEKDIFEQKFNNIPLIPQDSHGSNNSVRSENSETDTSDYMDTIFKTPIKDKLNKMKQSAYHETGVIIRMNGCASSMEEVNALVDTYIVEEGKSWKCKTCGKVNKDRHKYNMRKHVEIHIKGLSFECPDCGYSYGTRMSLNQHKKLKHSKRCQ